MVLFLAVYTKTFVAGTNISNILRDFHGSPLPPLASA